MKKNTQTQQTIIGVDLGDTKHAICVTDKDGDILKEYFITNTKASLKKLIQAYPLTLVAMEVGSHSPWISRYIAELGAKTIVANPRKLRAIYSNERKCDELDARMLAKIARLDTDLLYPVTHIDEQQQIDSLALKMRDSLVKQRVACLLTVKTTLKSLGLRIQKSSSPCFAGRAREYLVDQPEILCLISPSLIVLESLTDQIKILDKKVDALIKDKYPAAQRLQQIQGVGPITSLSFALYIDPNNFKHTRDVGAYLGLVPRRDQSGKIDKQLSISKTGNTKLRCLLVQASHYIMGPFGPECDLRKHGLKLASKGGKIAKRKAVVAVARKLSVVMLTLLQQQSDYRPIMKPTSEKVA
jgi:transposase